MIKKGTHSYIMLEEDENYKVENLFNADVIIGNYTSIGHSLKIMGDEHAIITYPKYVTSYNFGFYDTYWGKDLLEAPKRENITIGSDVWIGAHVSIRQGITIGDGAIIGAHCVVTKNVYPYEVVVGNPMKSVRFRYHYDVVQRLLQIKWWNWEEQKIRENLKYFGNINEFIKRF